MATESPAVSSAPVAMNSSAGSGARLRARLLTNYLRTRVLDAAHVHAMLRVCTKGRWMRLEAPSKTEAKKQHFEFYRRHIDAWHDSFYTHARTFVSASMCASLIAH